MLWKIADFLNEKYGANTVSVSCQDMYYNMYEKLKDKGYILERIQKAMESIGVTPHARPVRGSTDGARLSYMGLPCPNVCMGGENAHSIYEFSSVQALDGVSQMVSALMMDVSPIQESSGPTHSLRPGGNRKNS